jgi:phage terminase large subunit-like protein
MTLKDLRRYALSPIAFIDDLVTRNETSAAFRLAPHQRDVLRLAFTFDDQGRLPYDTFLYSCPKKSGKTTMNAALTVWWAFTQEAPNEVLVIANDYDQAQSRVFGAIARLIRNNRVLTESANIQGRQIVLSNGTKIVPLASDYAGAAGSNHGFTSWDELWGYSSESSRRLWEELTPVPTRQNSIRFVTTYAGFEGESRLLWDLYRQGVDKLEHPEGGATRLGSDLPVFANRASRLFAYWDHARRMSWQTPEYYETQRRTLRPSTFLRLHENRWAASESVFITPELWDSCVGDSRSPLLPERAHPLFVGVDVGIKHDAAAVVAVTWDTIKGKLILAAHRIWRPLPREPLDIEATVEAYLRQLHSRYCLRKILVDPYQLHRSTMTLKAAGLPIEEYPQTTANTTQMGQTLYDLLNGKNIELYPASDLREHALNTVAIEHQRGFRIAKEKTDKKIDAIVALAMACVAAIDGKSQPLQIYAV